MSLGEEMTVFDIKYKEAMERLDSLYSTEEDNNFNSIKNYIERFKLDRSIENRNNQKKENSKGKSDEKRKQIVDLYEIKIHEKKAQHYYKKNYLKNEIEWYKIKQREDEIKNKYNSNFNRQKYENDINQKELSKEIIRNNKIKMKKFSNLANKVNIEKFKQQKKMMKNINNLKEELNIETKDENNNNGKFIPYSKYKENELMNKRNKKAVNNINRININTNKSETINFEKKIKPPQNKINNNISQNIPNNNKINIKKEYRIKSFDKNKQVKNEKDEKRKPLGTKIDYLKEFEKKNQDNKIKIYENKKLLKNKNNINNNIEILNYHSKNFEDKAKRQEQLMRIRGNAMNEDNVKLSNLLIDSISTKLAILNQMSSQNS